MNPTILLTTKKICRCVKRYKELAQKEKGVIFGGRLGEYKYYDMDKVIASALNMCKKIL